MVGGPVVNKKMQTHLLVVLDILVLSEDPVDDDGQDTDPLVLHFHHQYHHHYDHNGQDAHVHSNLTSSYNSKDNSDR